MSDEPQLLNAPPQQFWSADTHQLIYHNNSPLDVHHNMMPHLAPRGLLCDADLTPLADE